ncbi:MAG: hypothetical protein R3293_28920, partial [Candidatus Promineifilaceae bacterium]|nr:hypothetical protein [Candidatus Promineifilaceae bacterium]
APAGFGKSTLILDWIQQSEQQVAWLSLDKSDNDPVRFWSYVFAAIKNAQPELAEDALAALGAPQQPPIKAVLTGLINRATSLTKAVILILEDYYLIDDPTIHVDIAFLLEFLPPQLQLLISGRSDPPLALATLRGHGLLSEIRESALRFSDDEAKTFFQQVMGLQLSAEDVAALNSRTEGWIVGLQLAGLALQGREGTSEFIAKFAGDHSYIINYLTDEVFERQSPSLQGFLLQTSILDRLHGSLCDAIISEEDRDGDSSQHILEYLVEHNLFLVPLDNRRQWYRYHRLFADLLHYRLQHTFADLIPHLHLRASAWFAENGFITDALQHTLAAGNFDQAADLIETVTRSMIGAGETRTVQAWIEALPDVLLNERPLLCVALAWVYNLNQAEQDIEPLLKKAEEALNAGSFDQEIVAEVRGNVALLRGYSALQHNNPPLAMQHMEESLLVLPEDDVYLRSLVSFTQGVVYKRGGMWIPAAQKLKQAAEYGRASGNLSVAIANRVHLIEMLITQGHLQQAAGFCDETIAYHQADHQRNPVPNLGFVYSKLGEILYEWNDLKSANDHLEQGLAMAEKLMVAWSWTRDGLVYLARIRQLQADFDAAQKFIERAIHMSGEMQDHFDRIDISYWQARLFLAQGNLPAAVRWATQYQAGIDGRSEAADRVLARVHLAQEETHQALQLLLPIHDSASQSGRMAAQIESLT